MPSVDNIFLFQVLHKFSMYFLDISEQSTSVAG